jgi:hypothetical protein
MNTNQTIESLCANNLKVNSTTMSTLFKNHARDAEVVGANKILTILKSLSQNQEFTADQRTFVKNIVAVVEDRIEWISHGH